MLMVLWQSLARRDRVKIKLLRVFAIRRRRR
jgi:hypothetical protein